MKNLLPTVGQPTPSVLPTGPNPYLPADARILRIQDIGDDIRLFDLRFTDPILAESFAFRPGQFVELGVIGVGEGPFSLPSSPTRKGFFQLGIRRAGVLTDYIFDHLKEGDTVGIRGPLGNGFPVEQFEGGDVLVVSGGLGMVPLRGLMQYLI
ncbi:MAG: cytochrome-c3 hydrogenase subunit gamma, partial [Acidobacteria bacterium]